MKKIEEENLQLLIERCNENDFYINRKLNNRRAQKYIASIKKILLLCDLWGHLTTFNFFGKSLNFFRRGSHKITNKSLIDQHHCKNNDSWRRKERLYVI